MDDRANALWRFLFLALFSEINGRPPSIEQTVAFGFSAENAPGKLDKMKEG